MRQMLDLASSRRRFLRFLAAYPWLGMGSVGGGLQELPTTGSLRRSRMRIWVVWGTIGSLALGASLAAQAPSPTAAPRIPPLAESEWSVEMRAAFERFGPGGRATNDLKTFARHPALLNHVMPFVAYVSRDSTLPPQHRELLVLRTAWLGGAEYLWAQHAAAAQQSGLSAAEIRRTAEGPDASDWDPFHATLLRAADELHVNAFLTDGTWNRLATRYDRRQMMDTVFAVGAATMVGAVLKTSGVPLDDELVARLPAEGQVRPTVANLNRQDVLLDSPRVPPLEPAEWTPEIRAMLDPSDSGRPIGAVFRTYAQHPQAYPWRQMLSDYIRGRTTLTNRTKEMLILRMAFLCQSVYQWSTHERGARRLGMNDQEILGLVEGPDAAVWEPFDSAVVRTADELHRDSLISDATWSTLGRHYNTQQRLDMVITAVGYRLVAMALNSFGVQMAEGAQGFPEP